MSEIEKAINFIKTLHYVALWKAHKKKHHDYLNLAEKALREKQERQNGCLSCNGDKWYFNRWCWIDEKGDPCHQEIKFCPICGRKLGENDG